jgi:DNA gyrase/topoisomerase IV subunit B
MATQYTSDNIKVLNDIEHIQLRSGMYIGEANDPRSLFSEMFDNAMDEVSAGHSTELVVEVDTKENRYTVHDFGRGIPHGKKKLDNGEEKEVVEILMTVANSGGKFDNSSYNYSAGLNGVGMTVTNALSETFTIRTRRSGKFVEATTHGSADVELHRGKTQELHGTSASFIPNKKFFHSDKIPLDFILSRCRIATALGFKARCIVDGEEQKTNSTIFDLIKEDDSKIATYVDIPVIEVKNPQGESMKVALRYTSDTKDRYFGYTNLLANYLGGTHVQCLAKAISGAWDTLTTKYKNLKPAVELKPSDYLVGLRGVCAVFISNPEFSSQTKEKLVVNKAYFDSLMEAFSKSLVKYLTSNIEVAQQLLKRFEEYRNAQNALLSRKEISSLIKINEDSGDNIRRRSVVSKLVECTSKKRDDTELFIVEGDSAMGPYLYVRDKVTQAVLPIRGKILNTTYKDLKEVIQNKEICDIANSIGCGIGAQCDATKSRYDRVIISADADPDGLQINCLVLAVFINLFPDMVKQGRVYISLPPLYCWGKSVKDYGWCNKVEDIPPTAKDVHRFKGLGEMNDDQLYYFLVDKNTRNVLQIEYPSDIDEFNKILGTSEGKGSLLKDLGIILSNEVRTFDNSIAKIGSVKAAEETKTKVKKTIEKKPAKAQTKVSEKAPAKKSTTEKKVIEAKPAQVNLFAGLFD